MPTLNSSAIRRAEYDWFSGQLAITFQSGDTYTFYGVPPDIYHGLLNASSAGRYYHRHIRGRFEP